MDVTISGPVMEVNSIFGGREMFAFKLSGTTYYVKLMDIAITICFKMRDQLLLST
jgi:hypothetical protein